MNQIPAAIGPYSTHEKLGNMIITSGQLPIDPEKNDIVATTIQEQTHQSIKNVQAILASEGYDLSNVKKATVYLSDINNFAAFNEVYASYFNQPYPARTAFEVGRLPKDALVEIEVIAYK